MSILKNIINSSNTKFVFDWDKGILNETVGSVALEKVGTLNMTSEGMTFDGSVSNYFRLGDDSSLELDDFTFVAKVKRDTNTGTLNTIFHCQCSAGGGALAGWYCRFSTLYFQIIIAKDGTTDERLTTTKVFDTSSTYILAIVKSGKSLKLYVDGVFVQEVTLTNATIPYVNAGYSFFGGLSTLGSSSILSASYNGNMSKLIYTGDILTATEIAQLTAELEQNQPNLVESFTQALYPSMGNNKLVDGDMELSGTSAWIVGLGGTLSKQASNLYGGSQCLRITDNNTNATAYQNVLVVGKKYRVRGWFRGDGNTGQAGILIGTTLVATSTTSNEWQWFDEEADANAVFFQFRKETGSEAVEYAEFDQVLLEEVGTYSRDVYFKGEMNAIANEVAVSSGFLENTNFKVTAGNARMITETVNNKLAKVIDNTSGQIISKPTRNPYGTYNFYYKATTNNLFYLIPSSRDNTVNSTGQIGFRFDAATKSIGLRISGSVAQTSSNDVWNITDWMLIIVIITKGNISMIIDGVTVIDYDYSTTITGDRMIVSEGLNHKLVWASENPEHSLCHKV